MAPEQGPIATGAPLATPSAPTDTTPLTTTSDPLAVANEVGRPRSLKRQRETTPLGESDLTENGELSPSKVARLVGYARQSPPPPLTGAAALEDERRRREEEQQRLEHPESSPNPTHRVLADLMSGVEEAMSRPHDGPSVDATSPSIEAASIAVARALNAVSIPPAHPAHPEHQEVSPQSAPSAASRETLSEGPGEVVHSPAPMDIDSRSDQRLYAQQPDAQMDDKTPGSLSYPGAMQPGNPMGAPPRGMSLPMTSSQNQDLSPRSPSNKKHKCGYCGTEFTRHHNLKSHLLTHSQEKPFVCQECSMRFRRLHDLKRHGKLHTGEKNHICPKCDRKFARGDALARHSKGSSGCAGRRPSMGGSFAEDDYDTSGMGGDDSAMAGVLYGESANDMSEEDRRRLSLPSIKAQHVPGQPAPEGYATHSNTYPPAGPRPNPPSGLYPPNIDRPSTGSTTSPSVPNSHTPHTSISSMPVSAGSSSMYSQSGMTESPRPVSPSAAQTNQAGHNAPALARQQSPVQQQHFRQPDQTASGLSLPSHGMSPASKQAWISHYPPADRDAPQANAVPSVTTSPSQQTAPRGRGRSSSGANAAHASNGVNVDNVQVVSNNEHQIWAYLQQMEAKMEAKMKQLVDELEATRKENVYLKEKLSEHEHHFAALTNEVATMRRPPAPATAQQLPPAPESVPPPIEHQQQPEEHPAYTQAQAEAHAQAHAQTQIPTTVAQP